MRYLEGIASDLLLALTYVRLHGAHLAAGDDYLLFRFAAHIVESTPAIKSLRRDPLCPIPWDIDRAVAARRRRSAGVIAKPPSSVFFAGSPPARIAHQTSTLFVPVCSAASRRLREAIATRSMRVASEGSRPAVNEGLRCPHAEDRTRRRPGPALIKE